MKKNTLVIFSLFCSLLFVYSCSKEFSLENSSKFAIAEGSLWDSAGSCLFDSVHGTYYNGIQPGSDTAYVEVAVNVTKAGSYNISSDFQNGLIFSDSGYFTTTGVNLIKLKPLGTPSLIQPTVFNFSFDSSACSFIIYVQDSTGTGLGIDTSGPAPIDSTNLSDTAWKFNVGTNYYHGQFDTAFLVDTLGLKYLTFVGSNIPNSDTSFLIGILLTSGSIQPGTYTTSFEAGVYLTTLNGSTPVTIYQADATTSASGNVTITISSYDSSTGIVIGTFTGTAIDSSGNPVTITNGTFKAKVT